MSPNSPEVVALRHLVETLSYYEPGDLCRVCHSETPEFDDAHLASCALVAAKILLNRLRYSI